MSNKKKPVVIMKFGGAALADHKAIRNTVRIITNNTRSAQLVIVVSALQSVTDSLHAVAELVTQGKTTQALSLVDRILAFHVDVIHNLDHSIAAFEVQQQIKTLLDLLKLFVKKISSGPGNIAQKDYIVSFGERLSVLIVSYALRQICRQKALPVDAAHLLTTTKEFGNAKPLFAESKNAVKKVISDAIAKRIIPVVTGYIGHAQDGCITTLGRGGSDYTATILASMLRVQKVILWKDVEGLYDKDPKQNADARLLKSVDYATALIMAKSGSKVLHPESITPVQTLKIPVHIKSFLNPHIPGTIIGGFA